MINKLQFSIGILSWKGYDSLTNSLLSYHKNGLSKLTKNKFGEISVLTARGVQLTARSESWG